MQDVQINSQTLSVALAFLAFLSGLLYIFIKMVFRQHSDSTDNKFTIQQERVDAVRADLSKLKESIASQDTQRDNRFGKQVEKVSQSIQELQVKLAAEYVDKEEFRREITSLKSDIASLRAAIKEVDDTTREQDKLLSKIDANISALCNE